METSDTKLGGAPEPTAVQVAAKDPEYELYPWWARCLSCDLGPNYPKTHNGLGRYCPPLFPRAKEEYERRVS